VVAVHAARTAEREAGFLLPRLHSGMRVLDAGCGPGSITVGLAAAVEPGQVVGVDIADAVLDQARELAASRGLGTVTFERGSITDLPFADASFDVAFAHTVLEHVRDPAAAVRELRRVVRKGGLIALRDVDWECRTVGPPDPRVEEAAELYARLWRHNGGHPRCGRDLRSLLLRAGCANVSSSASFRWDGSADETRAFAELLEHRLGVREMADTMVALGWADAPRLRQLREACRAWGSRPDALAAMVMVEAIGEVT
jgi:ubiquinone/menaquinone biosynthesis C-methylase UbiE